MSHISVKEALERLFKGAEKPASVFKQIRNEDMADLEIALRKMCGKVYKKSLQKKTEEIADWSPRGQWKIEKAITTKPGPTLDYSEINPEDNPISNPEAAEAAKTKRHADIEAKAPTIDYGKNPATKPKYYAGAADKAKQVRAKIETESKETALETMARRGQIKTPLSPSHPTMKPVKKDEGVNIEREHHSISDRGQWSIEKSRGARSSWTQEKTQENAGKDFGGAMVAQGKSWAAAGKDRAPSEKPKTIQEPEKPKTALAAAFREAEKKK